MAIRRLMQELRHPPQCKYMRSSLFWVVRQPRLVVSYRRFGTTYGSHL